MKDIGKIAVLDTSTARKITWAPNGNEIEESKASPRLLELLKEGYTVYIASTRTKLFRDGCDACLFELIPEDRFFTPDPMSPVESADSQGLLDLWEKVLTRFGVEIPGPYTCKTWIHMRHVAEDAGIVIR